MAPAPTTHPTEQRQAGGNRDELRLLTGRGRFIDDAHPRAGLHMALVRSPLAHAEINQVDVSGALSVPGVRAAYTGSQIAEHLHPFPSVIRDAPPYLPVAVDRARFVGEPLAVVIADDRYTAEDGCAAVGFDLTELDAVIELDRADTPEAPVLHSGIGSNVVWHRDYRYGDPDAAFTKADRIVEITTTFPRYNSTPLETAGVIADWDTTANELTVHANFQGPFSLHPVVCGALGLSTSQLRLVVPEDIGGSFGNKAMLYPAIALSAVCSKLAGAPVIWIEDRQEHLLASACGTNRITWAQAAVTANGTVLGLRYRIREDVGAYMRAPEPSCVMRSLTMFAGPYAIPDGAVSVEVVTTNKLPTGLNRGYGGQQHIFTLERLMDAIARDLDITPDEVRSRNLIPSNLFPYETPSGTRYDSGDYHAALERVLTISDYASRRRAPRNECDRWVGIGLATAVHSSAANMGYVTLALDPTTRAGADYRPKSGTRETVTIRVDASGKVGVEIASAGCGQGHRATISRLVSSLLGVPTDDVRTIDAIDTARSNWGVSTGSFSSRFTVMVGNAALLAAEELKRQLNALAARIIGAPVDELTWEDGQARHSATGRTLPLRQLAGAVHWDSGSIPGDTPIPALHATSTFTGSNVTPPTSDDRVNAALAYGFMADVAIVAIDKSTLIPRLTHYFAVHDLGRTLEPDIVAGQVAGGVTHGMGGALYEEIRYSPDGQPENTSFVDYLSPTASEAPEVHFEHLDVLSPSNPLGVKGGGESSAMSAPAAIAAAIDDALAHTDLRVDRLPIDPADLLHRLAGTE